MLRHLLSITIAIILVVILLNQCRRPRWWPGRFLLWIMNIRHSPMTDWALQHLSIRKDSSVLDVGCGGGRPIKKLCALANQGMIYGVDLSATSVTSARKMNSKLIDEGRVEIKQAPVSQLPFSDVAFDAVTAIETHYYWPNLVEDMQEIYRVLKPGGSFLIVAEAYKGMKGDAVNRASMKLLRGAYLSPAEYKHLLTAAGYDNIQIFENVQKGWLCSVARRPA